MRPNLLARIALLETPETTRANPRELQRLSYDRARTFVGRHGFNCIVANSEMKSALCRTLCLVFLTLQFSTAAQAYGPVGHEIVGAIADERLANTPTDTKIRALLDGLTLEKAAVLADEIKGWDKKGVDDPRSFHYSAHRNIDRQLRDFRRAFASLVPLHRRACRASAKIPRRTRRPQQMGRSPYDSVLRPGFAGTGVRTKRTKNYQARSTYFACALYR